KYKLTDAEPLPEFKGYEDSLGVVPQKGGELNAIGVPVVTGRITADQLDEISNIAAEFGSGEIRLTVMQNFIIPNVPHANVEVVKARLAAINLPLETSAVHRGVVACTGIEFCNLAVTETKGRAKNIV